MRRSKSGRRLVRKREGAATLAGLVPEVHVDDFIDRRGGDKYARWVLAQMRFKATLLMDFAPYIRPFKLFCTFEGERWRCTGASRLGWVLLSRDPEQGSYHRRVEVTDCSHWGPSWAQSDDAKVEWLATPDMAERLGLTMEAFRDLCFVRGDLIPLARLVAPDRLVWPEAQVLTMVASGRAR